MHPIKKGHFSAHFIQYIPAPWLQKACALEGRDTVKVGMVLWLLWSLKQEQMNGEIAKPTTQTLCGLITGCLLNST